MNCPNSAKWVHQQLPISPQLLVTRCELGQIAFDKPRGIDRLDCAPQAFGCGLRLYLDL